jgi:hypothetical protein
MRSLLSRLHGGLCAFQSLISSRLRPRTPSGRLRTGSPEPQSLGGRVVPLFGRHGRPLRRRDGPLGPELQTAPPMTPPAEETGPLRPRPA